MHLTSMARWAAAQDSGALVAPSLATEGFLHCAFADQVGGVIERHWRGAGEIMALTLDPQKLAGRLRVERSAGSGQDYPHLYGELPLAAVLSAQRMRTPEV
jgi:uncharacterized protein (DUF952 family)